MDNSNVVLAIKMPIGHLVDVTNHRWEWGRGQVVEFGLFIWFARSVEL